MIEFLTPHNIAVIVLGTIFTTIIVYLHNISKTFPKSPTYGDLIKRQMELIILCQHEKMKSKYEEELLKVSKQLSDIEKSIPRKTTPFGNYKNSFEDLKAISQELKTAYNASTNNINGLLHGRPDLSFITNARTKTESEFDNFYKGLRPDQAEIYSRADRYIPELIQIAEMYFDSMIGTDYEKSLPYAIVKQTLNYIANGKK